MTNAEAIAYLSTLPPDGKVELGFKALGTDDLQIWQIGRVEIMFAPKHDPRFMFLVGQDASIRLDDGPLDLGGLITAVDIHIERNHAVVLSFQTSPQPRRA